MTRLMGHLAGWWWYWIGLLAACGKKVVECDRHGQGAYKNDEKDFLDHGIKR